MPCALPPLFWSTLLRSNQRLIVADVLPASDYGHSSVIVFFVLSGFVIAYITDTKERFWVTYSASRLSRVYSVAVPALILTVLLDSIGRQLYPGSYDYPFDQFVVRLASSLLMLNEVWFASITTFSNVPYWSICYELWYYVVFGVLTFLPGRVAWWTAGGLLLGLGPKIIMLAPIWGAGVVLYRWRALQTLPMVWALAILSLSVLGLLAFFVADVEAITTAWLKSLIGADWHAQLTFSKFFLSDYLLTTLVFANFVAMRRVSLLISPLLIAIERPVRSLQSTPSRCTCCINHCFCSGRP